MKLKIYYREPGGTKTPVVLDDVDRIVPAGHDGFFTDFLDAGGSLILRLQSTSILLVERASS